MIKTNLKLNAGFTIIELLVVMIILSFLFIVSLANFRTSQIKSRDAQRKSDLRQIATALEAYSTDYGSYPEGLDGKIKACTCGDGTVTCDWGTGAREFCDSNNTVYIQEIPDDTSGSSHYCYISDGRSFQLYALLENSADEDAKIGSVCPVGGSVTYNFGISSSNTTP